MSNKVIGKFHEKRGDDSFEVVLDPSGEVIGITQYVAHRFSTQRIDLWAESAPKMISLIQKAAGIKVVEPEYEYSVVETYLLLDQDTSEPYLWYDKAKAEEWLRSCEASYESDRLEGKPVNFTSKLVKRRKAGKVEEI